jgi:hypothetical protein
MLGRPRQAGLTATVAAALITLVVIGGGAGGSSANGSATCGPPETRTLAENSYSRVYLQRARPRAQTGACSKRTGESYALDAPQNDETAFPNTALNRWYIAYAYNSADPDDVHTTIGLLDSRKFGDDEDEPSVGGSPADENFTAKVGSIVVNSRGAFAWIACPSRATFASLDGCDRPGVLARVWRVRSPGTRPMKLLDEGRRIDPSSLRLRGTRIRWMNSDERKKAKLE